MKKIWTYISVLLAGVLAGVMIAVKWLNESGVTVNVAKIKSKRSSGDMNVTVPIEVESPEKGRKPTKSSGFQQIRNRRKTKKDDKAILKKK